MEHLGPEMGFEATDLGGLDFPGEEHSSSTASSMLPSLPGVGTYSSSGPGGPETIFSGGSLDLQDYTTALSQNITIGGLDPDLATLTKSDSSAHAGGGLPGLYSHSQTMEGGNEDIVRHSTCSASDFGMSRMQTHSSEDHYQNTSITQALAVTSQSAPFGIERVERLISPTAFDVDAFLIRSTQQGVGSMHIGTPHTSMASNGPNNTLTQCTPGGMSFRHQGQFSKSSMVTDIVSQGMKCGGTPGDASQGYAQRMHTSLLQANTNVSSGISISPSPFVSSADQQVITSNSTAVKQSFGNYSLKDVSTCSADPYNIQQLEGRLSFEPGNSVLQFVPQRQGHNQGISHLRIQQVALSTQSSRSILPSTVTLQIAPNIHQSQLPESDPIVHHVSSKLPSPHSVSQGYCSGVKETPNSSEQQFLGIGGFSSLVTSTSLAKIKGQQGMNLTSVDTMSINRSSCLPPNSLLVKSEKVTSQCDKSSNPGSPCTEDDSHMGGALSRSIVRSKYFSPCTKEDTHSDEDLDGNSTDENINANTGTQISEDVGIEHDEKFSSLNVGNKVDMAVVDELVMSSNEIDDTREKHNTETPAVMIENSVTDAVEISNSSGDRLISSCDVQQEEHGEINEYNQHKKTTPGTAESADKDEFCDKVSEDNNECEEGTVGEIIDVAPMMEPESARGRWKRRWKGLQEKASEKRNTELVTEEPEEIQEDDDQKLEESEVYEQEHDEEEKEELSEEEDELNQAEEEVEEIGDSYDSSQDPLHESYDANAGLTALLTASKTAFKYRLEVNTHVDDSQCVINPEGLKRWLCDECPKSYTTKHNLITHKLGHSGIKPHCCLLCGKLFKQMSHLQTHMLTHGGVKPHVCVTCHRGFTQASHMKRHMATHMDRRPYVCQICERGFAYPSELKGHMEKHKKSKDNACEDCGEKFESSKKMRQHLLLAHRNVAELTCKECGKVFTYPSQLRDHMVKHSGRRPYMCGECGMEFMKEHHLKAHQFTHTGLRPYVCAICHRSFNQKANMQRHMLIHEDSKKYKCDVCDRMFSQPQTLKAHQVTHSDRKPFHCEICGKEFGRLHNLQGHMHIHKDSKPHLCFCGSSFTLKGNLNRHKKVKHGLSIPSECTEEEAAQILNSMSTGKRQVEVGEQEDSSATEDTPRKKRKSQPRKSVPTNSDEEEKDSDNEWESDRDMCASPVERISNFRRQIQFDEASADLDYSNEPIGVNEEMSTSSISGQESKLSDTFDVNYEENSNMGTTAAEFNEKSPVAASPSHKSTSLLDKKFKQSKALHK